MSNIEAHFEWIPSHCGIEGNEIADKLAKEGARKSNIEIEVPYIKDELENYMSAVYKETWQLQWDSTEKGKHLRLIQPNVSQGESFKGLNRKEEVLLHQLRLGKCKLNHYLQTVKQHDNGLCSKCSVPETIDHFLVHCKLYDKERRRMQRRLRSDTLDWKRLLGNDTNFRILLDYIRETKRFDI